MWMVRKYSYLQCTHLSAAKQLDHAIEHWFGATDLGPHVKALQNAVGERFIYRLTMRSCLGRHAAMRLAPCSFGVRIYPDQEN